MDAGLARDAAIHTTEHVTALVAPPSRMKCRLQYAATPSNPTQTTCYAMRCPSRMRPPCASDTKLFSSMRGMHMMRCVMPSATATNHSYG